MVEGRSKRRKGRRPSKGGTSCKVTKGTASVRPHRELGSATYSSEWSHPEASKPDFHIPMPDGSQHKATLADTNPGAPGSLAMGELTPVAQAKSFTAEMLVQVVEDRSPGSQVRAPRAVREILGGRVALPQCPLHRGLWPPVRVGSQERLP